MEALMLGLFTGYGPIGHYLRGGATPAVRLAQTHFTVCVIAVLGVH